MILLFFIFGCMVGSLLSLFLYSLVFVGAQTEKFNKEHTKWYYLIYLPVVNT